MTNNVFSFKRLGLLIKLDLSINYKMILIIAAAVGSVLFLYGLAAPIRDLAHNFHPVIFYLLLFTGGLWISSLAFRELHDEKKNYLFLTIPSSICEKFLCKLLLTSVGYVAMLAIGYFLLSLLIDGINSLLFKYPQPIFNFFDPTILSYVKKYFMWQAIFLLGSIYFEKNPATKIVLTITSVVIIFFIVMFIFSALFLNTDVLFSTRLFDIIPGVIKTIFWILLTPFCWLITYLRLAETEL